MDSIGNAVLQSFPVGNFSLIALILGLPLLGALVNGVWGKRLGDQAVKLMALSVMGVSFVAATLSFLALAAIPKPQSGRARLVWHVYDWMVTAGGRESPLTVGVTFSIDALSAVMMLVITGIGFLIHLYATSYMKGDGGYARFFAYLNLFVFSMLVLILGDNLPLLFVGWEGVGLCSYLLIGFWYEKNENAAAGKKAFIANRIGDFGLIAAMCLLAYYTNSLDWLGIERAADALVNKGAEVPVWPLGGGKYEGFLSRLQPAGGTITMTAATAIGLALLLGCTGKSAQIPLYVWLPDAMAGPTPVSALIHAATMVTAGIYLVCRLSFVFVLSPTVMTTMACIGAGTALFAATIALVQNDIKKVLAYSTVSQLGFMFLATGVGAFTAAFFHVFTHAFFKACLFLGAGSVIHSMHANIHDSDASQDVRNMGGLRKYMPYTHATFAAATAAIVGLPFVTSGFFSKDEILYRAFVHRIDYAGNPAMLKALEAVKATPNPAWIGTALYVVGVVAATLTAFYMMRVYVLTFWGSFRGWKIGTSHSSSASDHASSHDDHGAHDPTRPAPAPHESPWQMTVPLIILATFSVFAGYLNPGFHIFKHPPMETWLAPIFQKANLAIGNIDPKGHMEWTTAIGGVSAFLVGVGLAFYVYHLQSGRPAQAAAKRFPGLHKLVLEKWRIDELYEATGIAAVDSIADTSAAVDKWIVDGILARVSAMAVSASGTLLRAVHNGVVHVYAALMVLGMGIVAWYVVMPHPAATVVPTGAAHTVVAGSGLGYKYQWDVDGDGKLDTQHDGKSSVSVSVEPGASKTVGLEVTNAFGVTSRKAIVVAGPPPAPSVRRMK